jgi:hypothetical protein
VEAVVVAFPQLAQVVGAVAQVDLELVLVQAVVVHRLSRH